MKNTLFLFLFSLFFVACGDGSSTSKNNSKDSEGNGFMTDSRDGQTYKIVQIGSQTWMAQNLNYKTAGSNCYNNRANNCAKYGRFYTWAAAMDSVGKWDKSGNGCGYGKTCSPSYPVRGVCPAGWHLPSKTEWETLFDAVGGQSTASTKLKSKSGWYSNGNGTDAFGFSALPAGYRYYIGSDYGEGDGASFWGSTENSSDGAYHMYLDCDRDNAFLYYYSKNYGFSVRCVKD